MKRIDIGDATHPLAEYARELHDEPLVVTLGGKPVAALMPVENADVETVSLSTDPKFLALIERSRVRLRTEGGVTSEELRRRLLEASPDQPSRK